MLSPMTLSLSHLVVMGFSISLSGGGGFVTDLGVGFDEIDMGVDNGGDWRGGDRWVARSVDRVLIFYEFWVLILL